MGPVSDNDCKVYYTEAKLRFITYYPSIDGFNRGPSPLFNSIHSCPIVTLALYIQV